MPNAIVRRAVLGYCLIAGELPAIAMCSTRGSLTEQDSVFVMEFGKQTVQVTAHIQCDDSTTEYRFAIHAQSTGKQLASFSDTTDLSCSFAQFEFIDVNFDGFKDIRVASDFAYRDIVYSVALYDPETHTFKHSEEFSDLCCDLEFDEKTKVIIGTWAGPTGNGWESRQDKYKVMHNHPVTFEQEESTEWTERDTIHTRTVTSKLIDGNMTVVKDTTTIESRGVR